MNLYLETSAALRDVLEGDDGEAVRALLRRADVVVASRLTIGEVGRVLARMRVLDAKVAARVAAREAEFVSDRDLWHLMPIDEAILERCARPFPVEPVRMLDAVHLATIERVSASVSRLVVLSTDTRVRANAEALGFELRP
ncbi:MAG: PIN domain-containing protein [Myxococcota bacterium]